MSAPLINIMPPKSRSAYSIEFKAQINPNGLNTTYNFEFDTDINFNTSTMTDSITLAPDTIYQDVFRMQTGLIASTNYFYRVIASNIDGTSTSSPILTSTLGVAFSTREYDQKIETEKFKYTPLYRDFNQFSPHKNPFVYNTAAVAQGIHNIYNCSERQRFFKNAFGSKMDRIPFELIDDDTIDLVKSYMTEPIELWEPRAYIDPNSDFDRNPDTNELFLQVIFGLKDNPSKLSSFKYKR